MMQIFAQNRTFGYFSNQKYCILQYITDSIRLIPLCILLLPHLVCPAKSFIENTTLGVSHYETYRSCVCCRPRPYRRCCFHTDRVCFRPEQGHGCPNQHASGSDLPSGRSQCLRYGSDPLICRGSV